MYGQSWLPCTLNQPGTAPLGERRGLQGDPKPGEPMETATQKASPATWISVPTKAIRTRLAEAS